MTSTDKRRHGVLRGAATHMQPRTLPRPQRQAGEGATASAREALPAGQAVTRIDGAADAYAQGLEAGRAAGMQQGLEGAQKRVDDAMRSARQEFEQVAGQRLQEFKTEANARLAQLERLLANFESAAHQRVGELESDAIALAYSALCKVLGDNARDPVTIAAIVRQGMAQLSGSALLAVRMNEADLRILLGDEQGRRLQAAAPRVKWVADSSVAAGGCLLDTAAGSLDARLETQLATLRALWASTPDPEGPSA